MNLFTEELTDLVNNSQRWITDLLPLVLNCTELMKAPTIILSVFLNHAGVETVVNIMLSRYKEL